MDKFYDVLKQHIADHKPNFGSGDSVLSLLYEAYSECNRLDDDRIKADFHELYRQMNGLDLREMDHILDPVCSICLDHERAEFIEGVKIGIRLSDELANPATIE